MKALSFTILLVLTVFLSLPAAVDAQIDEQCPHIEPLLRRKDRFETAATVREQLIKLCIKENKKEFERLVERTEEIAKLTDELKTSYDENQSLTSKDKEKLERVQDLVKKVRSELRASSDKDDKKDLPKTVVDALNELQESASNLLVEIKKTTRHSVSLVAIKSSNTVMKIVKFLRFGN